MRNRVLLAVPVHNEAPRLGVVLDRALDFVAPEDLLIIDDGSTDGTRALVRSRNLALIEHTHNQGKGACIKHAIRYGKEKNYQWLLCMDGDGQHDPREIDKFLRLIERDRADLILGNRINRRGRMPFLRQASNLFTSLILSFMIQRGRPVRDSQCGFRAVRLSAVKEAWFCETGFQFESELLLVLGRRSCVIEQIPITTLYGDQQSKINLLRDTYRFIRLVIKSL